MESTGFAARITGFYSSRGVECSVRRGQDCLLVMLCADTKTHEFRYGDSALADVPGDGAVNRALEREYSELISAAGPFPSPRSAR